MPIPPKAPAILVSGVTHQSIELSWEPFYAKLSAVLGAEDGKLKVEVQLRKGDAWDMVYRGFDTKCTCRGLQDSVNYFARFRFGNNSGWGDFSEEKQVKTERKPFTGEDVHRFLRRQDEFELRRVLQTGEVSADTPDEKGFSPMMHAALAGRAILCELLLEFGADVNWSGESGKTALMMVAYKGIQDSVEFLLDHGASVQQSDRKGMSPLHYAVDGEKVDAIKSLLAQGADARCRDRSGCSPLVRCAMLKNNGNANVAKVLLGAGANPDDADDTGQCALFYCTLHRHAKMAELLLEAGADPRAQTESGVTAMSVAEGQDSRVMRTLLEKYIEKRKR